MTPLIIIQARLGSTRLPGKVLMPIKGKPMLRYLIERVSKWPLKVATPDRAIFDACLCPAYIGDEDDVASRFAIGIDAKYDTFVRLCGDSPLMDAALIDAAIALYEPPYLEIRSPVGCVEVCDTASFLAFLPNMNAHEREHVTGPLRVLGRTIRIGSEPRLVVDTIEDFRRVENVINKMTKNHVEYGWRECMQLR